MTREQVLKLLATAGRNLDVYENSFNGCIQVTEPCDEWAEIFPGVDMEEFIESIEEKISESALSASGDIYRYYEFDGFTVVWGSEAFDE